MPQGAPARNQPAPLSHVSSSISGPRRLTPLSANTSSSAAGRDDHAAARSPLALASARQTRCHCCPSTLPPPGPPLQSTDPPTLLSTTLIGKNAMLGRSFTTRATTPPKCFRQVPHLFPRTSWQTKSFATFPGLSRTRGSALYETTCPGARSRNLGHFRTCSESVAGCHIHA